MAADEPDQPQNSSSAANARVTQEELAQALAFIQARREEEAKRQEATISLGQAVADLGLDVDAEEILAQVEAQREQSLAQTPPLFAPVASVSEEFTAQASISARSIEINACPICGRRLLTRTSALCNWCGARIDDPNYQAQAEAQRQTLDQAERTQVEIIAQEEARYGVFGRLKRRAKQGPGPKPSLG